MTARGYVASLFRSSGDGRFQAARISGGYGFQAKSDAGTDAASKSPSQESPRDTGTVSAAVSVPAVWS